MRHTPQKLRVRRGENVGEGRRCGRVRGRGAGRGAGAQRVNDRCAGKPDLKPTAHWAFDETGVTGKTVADKCGKLSGTLLGTPTVVTDGPSPHLRLNGPDDGVLVKDRITPETAFLPKDALSVVAWVRIDEPTEWGAFLGCFQDNGPVKNGFVVGFNKRAFFFGLSTGRRVR